MSTALQEAAERLISQAPEDLPAGTTPPAGVALGYESETSSSQVVAGYRTIAPAVPHPMTLETAHDLASVTKIVATTTSLMRLVSDRLLTLDDQVRRFIPRFSGAGKDEVTVRDLLLHRGGLWEWHPIYLGSTSPQEAVRFAVDLPLRYSPRTERHYSDLGFIVLGQVISLVTDAPLDQAVHELVTGPLGMTSTRYAKPVGSEVAASSFGDQTEITMIDTGVPYPVPYRSVDFARWRHDPIIGEVNDGNAFHALGGVSGHAGLFSTIPDLTRYAVALANYAEHDKLWSPRVAEEFFGPGPDDGQSIGFRRYDFRLDGELIDVLGHTGFVGCAVGFAPGRGLAIVLASNRLLCDGIPVPGERIWQASLAAVSDEMSGNEPN